VDNIGQIALAMGYSEKKMVKIASPDMLSWGLLDRAFQLFDEVIISTGMHSTKEIFQLGTYLRTAGVQHKATLLHCISKYPAGLKSINMDRVKYIQSMGFKWGYSDHSSGIEAAVMACAMGAEYVEKHVTISKKLRSRDAHMSSTFSDLSEIVRWNLNFDIIRGECSMYELDKHDYAMREKYIGKWGDNK
jgi:sialic acid synthase SpsE